MGVSQGGHATLAAAFHRHKMWVLHCVAQYPCPDESLRLGNIGALKRHFASARVRIGYSGHEEGIAASLAAIDMGAEMVERHFCLSRHSFVHHIECSLEPHELAELVTRAGSDRKAGEGCEELSPRAYDTHFGMSQVERSFLVEKTYGTKYVGTASDFAPTPLLRALAGIKGAQVPAPATEAASATAPATAAKKKEKAA